MLLTTVCGVLLMGLVASIQTIDLDSRTDLQTVVDREPGQYLGHVSTATLGDGSVLAAYPKGHGKGPIVLKRTLDGGRTWSERLPTPENWSTSLETPTLHRVRDSKTGKMRLILWSGLYPARIASSENEGRTWTGLEPVGKWGGIVVMGSVVTLKNGDLLSLFHDDGRFFREGGKAQGTFSLYQTRSADGGRTWSEPETIWSGSDIHLCEPGAVRSRDGKNLAVVLRENRRVKRSHVMFTTDEAASWSAPKEVSQELTGDRHTFRMLPDGRFACTFRDMGADSPWKGDWVLWVGSWSDLEKGTPGQARIRLKDNKNSWDCGYPGLELSKDGALLAVTYGHWTEGEPPYILAVRLPLSELPKPTRGQP